MNEKKHNLVWIGVPLILFSFFNVYIYMLQNNQLSCGIDYCILIFNVIVLACIVFLILKIIAKHPQIHFKSREFIKIPHAFTDRKYFFAIWIVQIIAWLPIFLAYYPGFLNYDVEYQITQSTGSYTTLHPLIHTLYLKFFYYCVGGELLHDYTAGVAAANIVQLVCFSAALSYVHLFLRRMGGHKYIRLLVLLITCFLPVFPMLAISTTKDIFFSSSVAILFTSLGYLVCLPCFFSYGIFVAAILGTVLFRSNGLYPVLILLLVFFAQYLKARKNLKVLVCTTVGIVVSLLISASLKGILKADSVGMNEALSLPYQQIACAYRYSNDAMTSEEIDSVKTLLPKVDSYVGYLSDPVKNSGTGGENFKELIRTYFNLMLKHPRSYVRAFCELNAGYLGITDNTFGRIYGVDNRQGILLSDIKNGFNVSHMSFLPGLEELYESLFSLNKYENVLILNILCKPAAYFWLLISFISFALYNKEYSLIPMILFLAVLLLTMLAGPCVLIRYALPYIICTPIMGICAVYEKRNRDI